MIDRLSEALEGRDARHRARARLMRPMLTGGLVVPGVLACFHALLPCGSAAQQVGDTAFTWKVPRPAFPAGEGPRVLVDEAHGNFHTASGRFAPFARLLRADGFVVKGLSGELTATALGEADVLVVANALHPDNEEDWSLPTPSAFTTEEVDAVEAWVEEGGALLLIADHMPFPGAAEALAARFGFEMSNGFAMDTTSPGPFVFRRSDGSLADDPITAGRGPDEAVDSVATFTGQAFRAPPAARTLLTLRDGIVSFEPEVAWEFPPETPRVDVGGWPQGAVVEVGRGRVAVFGEAAMFTAQRVGDGEAMGMNAPIAGGNPRFVLNLLRWLAGGPRGLRGSGARPVERGVAVLGAHGLRVNTTHPIPASAAAAAMKAGVPSTTRSREAT